MTCRYDRDAEDYLDDGEPCRRDSYGDPTHHCTARRTCAQHVGKGELTCARCIGRTRTDLRRILDVAALMPEEAIETGVDSEAANLAGPAADPEAWTWRKVAARQGRAWHLSLVEDDDEQHPYLRCGARAYLRAELLSGAELLFCAHHANEHGDRLREIAAIIHDETDRLAPTAPRTAT